MKAAVYIIWCERKWTARWTIALDVDLAYWRERKAGALSNGAGVQLRGGGRKAEGKERLGRQATVPANDERERSVSVQDQEDCGVVMLWDELLPLSVAEEIIMRWTEEKAERMAEQSSAVRMLMKAVAQSTGRSEKAVTAGQAKRVEIEREGGDSITTELWRRSSAVAERLSGRAALVGEVQELLASGPPACRTAAAGGWSAIASALQLAALRGLLRLRSAAAPQQPAASPLRRLLPEPLRGRGRARPWRRRCLRCGSGEARMNRTACAACGSSACAYCEACLTMGRSRECGLLVHGGGMTCLADAHGAAMPEAAPSFAAARAHGVPAPAAPDARWGLSPAQQAAAAAALAYARPRLARSLSAASHSPESASPPTLAPALSPSHAATPSPMPSLSRSPESASPPSLAPALSLSHVPTPSPMPSPAPPFLLWAVTGAGKTEMIFPLIEAALAAGGRALVATPRRDVVLELDPRIRRAFPSASVVTLYGGSEQRWEDGEITLATTHQLFRFHGRFHLVIVDELDAFPYHNDERLHYAAAQSCAPGGAVILLSATPAASLQRAAKRGTIGCARVPVRYHRHPLPVPELIPMPAVAKQLARRQLPKALLARLRTSLERGAQCFVFVQQIRQAEPLAALLRAVLPGVPIGATSSQDGDRSHRVQLFRDRELRILVTTTILERGVTVPRSDVFVLDADGKLFDESSLVQMAGRAGRSKDDPAGRVYFFAAVRNRSQLQAVRQIKGMNREAATQGYLLLGRE